MNSVGFMHFLQGRFFYLKVGTSHIVWHDPGISISLILTVAFGKNQILLWFWRQAVYY
jgi:hypothetical protein